MEESVIVVGGGLAGLAATMRLAERGCSVQLVCLTKAKRSHSVCAQGGINIALDLLHEGDSPYIHAYEAIRGGDFLANQSAVLEMCLAGPGIIALMDRLGCPFNRVVDGQLDVRKFGGVLYRRTVFCGSSTGQQLLYTLDEQVRRHEVQGKVGRFEHHEFLRLVQDEKGRTCGIVVLNLFNSKLEVLKAKAVVFATGGPGMIFGKSTNSTFCTGAANGRLYMQGMRYANGEFIQIHPTAVPGQDKMRLMTETIRGEGGRMWVYGDESKTIKAPDGRMLTCGKSGEPWYFLEELYPGYGNTVPRDVGSREILRICEMGLGIDGKMEVYLDIREVPEEKRRKLEATLEIYQKFTGDDPRKVPMKVFPAVHYSMGGAWVDYPAADAPDREQRFRHMTNLRGCFNCGESDYQYHGANRLGGNSLLSCIFGGLVTGDEVPRYIASFRLETVAQSIFDEALNIEQEKIKQLLVSDGKENAYKLHEELGDLMLRYVTVKRNNADLKMVIEKLKEIREKSRHLSLNDASLFANQGLHFALRLPFMVELALVIAKGAYLRNESRGAHYKEDFTNRDDENFLKTTIATYDPKKDEPIITYEEVDMRHLKPEKRDYTVAKKVVPELMNIPREIKLPV